jgi:hypothetical protein
VTSITIILVLVVLAVVILAIFVTSEVNDDMYRSRSRGAPRDRQ